MRCLLFCAAACAMVVSAAAHADMYKQQFIGTVDSITGTPSALGNVSVGDSFTFGFIVDTDMNDIDPSANAGTYMHMTQFHAIIGDSYMSLPGDFTVQVFNDASGADMYSILANDGTMTAMLGLADLTQSMFNNDGLPVLNDADGFTIGTGEISGKDFTITGTFAGTIPAPASLCVLALGLAVGKSRRRK